MKYQAFPQNLACEAYSNQGTAARGFLTSRESEAHGIN